MCLFYYPCHSVIYLFLHDLILHVILMLMMGSIFFIFLDELMMGSSQSRMGPLNLGWYGILASLINGCNLIISQLMVPKVNVHFGFQAFPMFFFLFSMRHFMILYPFSLVDMYVSMILMLLLTGMSLLFIIFSAFSGCSKYSILGSMSLISQFISFELMFTMMLLILFRSWNDLSIVNMWFINKYIYCILFFMLLLDLISVLLYLFFINCFMGFVGNNPVSLLFFFLSLLGESNSVPFDLPEAESESVAGSITEYSSMYFSLILLTEYASIIAMSFRMMILFSMIQWFLMCILLLVCFLRSTLNRLKFDELMTNAWIMILPMLFTFLLMVILILTCIIFAILFVCSIFIYYSFCSSSYLFYYFSLFYILILLLLGSMIGMMIESQLLLKFFLCYETFFSSLSVMMLLCSNSINAMIMVCYLLWNSTFEVVLALSVLLMLSEFFYSLHSAFLLYITFCLLCFSRSHFLFSILFCFYAIFYTFVIIVFLILFLYSLLFLILFFILQHGWYFIHLSYSYLLCPFHSLILADPINAPIV